MIITPELFPTKRASELPLSGVLRDVPTHRGLVDTLEVTYVTRYLVQQRVLLPVVPAQEYRSAHRARVNEPEVTS